MSTGRYELNEADMCGEQTIARSDDLTALLDERDRRIEHAAGRRYFRVLDSNDYERGEANWCEECGNEPTFTYDCASCRGEEAAA